MVAETKNRTSLNPDIGKTLIEARSFINSAIFSAEQLTESQQMRAGEKVKIRIFKVANFITNAPLDQVDLPIIVSPPDSLSDEKKENIRLFPKDSEMYRVKKGNENAEILIKLTNEELLKDNRGIAIIDALEEMARAKG